MLKAVPAETEKYVSVKGVSKVFNSKRGTVTALENINLDIARAEFISVLGPSGCGKSTLLRCLAGLEPPTSGDIKVSGVPVSGPPEGMGVVFQKDVLLEWRNVLDNVLLPVEVKHEKRKEWEGKAMKLLAKLGLSNFEKLHPWELSGGMRQRVSICRALLMNPQLLLMDEPFGALDAMTRDELNLELQRVWVEDAKTVFFVTHSIAEAVFLADRVIVMSPHPGRILDDIPINLPRPRDLSLRETPQFGVYTRKIRTLFEQMGVFGGKPHAG